VADFSLGHRKSLDGVRGLAIVFVLFCHVPSLPLGGGFIGVDLFFVLSGFLITTLLLEERRETGGIRLRAFYARRALRLLPALIAMLLVMVGISAWKDDPGEAANTRTGALMTLFYSANWFMAFKAYPCWELLPTWSLSVEEQFYLLWPLLLLILLKLRASPRSLAAVAASGLLLSAGWRALLWTWSQSYSRVYYGADSHADGLLAGSLAGILVSSGALPSSPALTRVLNWSGHLTLGLLFLFLRFGWAADAYVLLGGLLVLNLGMASLVVCLLRSPGPVLKGLFEFPPLVWIGRISYGLYLWHMVTFALGHWFRFPIWAAGWPVTMAATVAVAALSFVALEQPLLRLKRRFARVSAPPP